MTSPIRLLVLNCEFPPIGGGAATATFHLLHELASFPVEATLITAAAEGRSGVTMFGGACRIHNLSIAKKALHYWTNRELAEYALAAARRIRRLEREGERFDLCHAFFTVPSGAAAWWFARSRQYVVSLRGSDVPGFSGRFTLLYRALRPLIKAVWRRAGAVVANSGELKALALESAPGADIGVIPNGIDTEEFHPGPWREDGKTLLTVARLVPRKDVVTAIRATAILAKEFPDARLIIVGDGPEAGALAETAAAEGVAERIGFRRYVPREKMAETYREADVFVLTSMREGMSNTILEAVASGLPLVASSDALSGIDAPGAAVVRPGDAAATAAAAAGFLRNANARRRAREASRAASADYTWRAMAQRYFEVYGRVLASKGRHVR